MTSPSDEPDLQVGGFSLWVHGREFPDMDDYWDSNWLNVTARMEASGARVETEGPILRIDDLHGFAKDLATLNQTLKGSVELKPLEPNLCLSLQGNGLGQIAVELSITPDHLDQDHVFRFGLDQTYLGPLITSCEAIIEKYPVRGLDS